MTPTDNTLARTLHDLGLAAWFAAHLAGGAVLTEANKGRLAGQQGVAAAATVKTALTVAALGTTAYARLLGRKLERAGDVPVEGGTTQITKGLLGRLLPGR